MSREKYATEIKIRTKNGIENMWLAKTAALEKKSSGLMTEIIGKVYRLCCEGFSQEDTAAFRQDVERHVREEKICLIFEDQRKRLTYTEVHCNKLKAFASYRIMRVGHEEILYVSAVVVAPKMQRQNIASALIGELLKTEGLTRFALRTQNPVMCKSVSRVRARVYPPLFGRADIPDEILDLGAAVAAELGMERYHRDLMTEPGTYGGHCLYGEEPRLEDAAQNESIADLIRMHDGDSMIMIGVVG